MNKKQMRTMLFAMLLSPALFAQPGSLDISFGAAGKMLLPIGTGEDLGHAAALQSDGKIVVAGWAKMGAAFDFALARFTAEGAPDSSFGTHGKLTTAFGPKDDYATSVAVQPDGKIVAAGWSSNGADLDFALARYHPDGSLDHSFGIGGKTTTDLGSTEYVASVVLQTDGKIVVAGHSVIPFTFLDFILARYQADGTLDAGFGTAGIVTTDFKHDSDLGASVALQPDGKIIVAGMAVTGPDYDFALARYNTDGTPDTGFGTGGKTTTGIGSSDDKGIAVAVQPDGKIVAGGFLYRGPDFNYALARYQPDGTLDTGFGTAGTVSTDFYGDDDAIASLALQSDGKILAAGRSHNGSHYNFALARYSANGVPDAAFGTAGKVVTPVAAGFSSAFAVLVQSGGKIVLAGHAFNGVDQDFALVRYNAGSVAGTKEVRGTVVEVSVYPNPVAQQATLEFTLNDPETLSIRLIDAQGKVIKTFVANEQRTAGKHAVTILLPEFLPSGQYFISIAAQGGSAGAWVIK